MSDDKGTPTSPPEGSDRQVLSVEVDGKTVEFTPEKAAELLGRQAAITQKEQTVAEVLKACDRYGTDPANYVKQAEVAFLAVNKAHEAGLIDDQGNLVPPKQTQDPAPQVPTNPMIPTQEPSRQDETIMKGLSSLADEVKALKQDNDRLIRMNLGRDLQAKYKDLDARDISELFTMASQGSDKTLDELAETMVENKKKYLGSLEKDFAKKYGVNLEEWEKRNALEDEDATSPGVMFKDKKISFKGGKDSVTPRAAMMEFMKRQNQKG